MCGIAGILGAISAVQAEASLRAMLEAQLHRGPDDGGWSVLPTPQSTLALGNRRLAIQDLSPLGHQPMRNQETGDILVYNGEIYNAPQLKAALECEGYRFLGHSDTEILLRSYQCWGVECLHRLRGMFAFAIWDARRLRLVIARDHLGIKPLYYGWGSHCLVCASEIRALLKSGLVCSEVDRRALAGYLAYGGVQEPFTIIKNVHSLPRGSWCEFDSAGKLVNEGKYWRLPAIQQSMSERSLPDIVEEGRTLLQESVHRHLLSDVQLGVFLSSGLDSSAILGLSQIQNRTDPIAAVTVTFPDHPEYNEQQEARLIARRFGACFHESPVTDDTAVSWVSDALQCMDQPSMDGFNTYIVARAVRDLGIVVALSGLGGDELFGGYDTFRRVPRTYNAMSLLGPLSPGMRITAARLASVFSGRVAKQKARAIAVSDPGLIGLYFQYRRLVPDADLGLLGFRAEELELSSDFQARDLRFEDTYLGTDHVASIGRLDTAFYLQNILLRDSDVFGMANSLEIRVPFLDRDLVEWAFSLPGRVFLPKKGAPKHLLRQICRDLFGAKQVTQPKRGFTLPFARWILGPLRDTVEENISFLRRSGLVDTAGIDSLQRLYRREPVGPAWSRVWALATLGHWLRTVAATGVGNLRPPLNDWFARGYEETKAHSFSHQTHEPSRIQDPNQPVYRETESHRGSIE